MFSIGLKGRHNTAQAAGLGSGDSSGSAACRAARTLRYIAGFLADFQPAVNPFATTPACGRGFAVAAFQAAPTEICIKLRPFASGHLRFAPVRNLELGTSARG